MNSLSGSFAFKREMRPILVVFPLPPFQLSGQIFFVVKGFPSIELFSVGFVTSYLFNSVGQGCAEANDECLPDWFGISGLVSKLPVSRQTDRRTASGAGASSRNPEFPKTGHRPPRHEPASWRRSSWTT